MRDDDDTRDLELIKDAALSAGQIAMGYFRRAVRTWDKEPGHPVTEADIAVNTFLTEHLRGARPDYGWLSEETADGPDRLTRSRVFVVDPIDGTRAFMSGDPHFCVAIAVLEDGLPVASVVYAPVFDEMYEAVSGQGAYRNGMRIGAQPRQSDVEMSRLIGERSMFDHPAWPEPWPKLVLPRVKPNATAYRLVLVADGRWDGVVVLWRKGDWDLAAPSLILQEAGGVASCHTGEPYLFNRKIAAQQSLIAGNPMLHERLVERCKTVRLPHPNDS